MYRLLRRISSTISSRIDKTWNGDGNGNGNASSSVPQVGSKRRRDSDDDDAEGVDETGRIVGSVMKRSKLVSQVADAPEERSSLPPPSPSPSPRESSPEPTIPNQVSEAPLASSSVAEETTTDEATTELVDPTGAKESSNGTIDVVANVVLEDNKCRKPGEDSPSAKNTSSPVDSPVDATLPASEDVAPATIQDNSSPPADTQSPELDESTTLPNTEVADQPITNELEGAAITSEAPPALSLSTLAPIEVQ